MYIYNIPEFNFIYIRAIDKLFHSLFQASLETKIFSRPIDSTVCWTSKQRDHKREREREEGREKAENRVDTYIHLPCNTEEFNQK